MIRRYMYMTLLIFKALYGIMAIPLTMDTIPVMLKSRTIGMKRMIA